MTRARTLILAAILVACGGIGASAFAGDVSMAGGAVQFSTPDNWVGIMQTQGDPEAQVFQVPDSSATGNTTLARVTVTVKQVASLDEFQQYVIGATNRAKALTGYVAGTASGAPNDFIYTAQESGARLNYRERYWFSRGHAVQLRCARPAASASGPAWNTAFDRGCDAIAAKLQA